MNIVTIIFLNDSGVECVPRVITPKYHESEFNIIKAKNSSEVFDILDTTDVSIILTSDSDSNISKLKWGNLYNLPNYIFGKWINIPDIEKYDSENLANIILDFIGRMISAPRSEFFSIITPIYHTKPHVFNRLYESLKNQTFKDWEWVIIDDSKDKSKTRYVENIANKDYRIRYFNQEHTGNIGQVKKRGFMLSEGSWLMEVDHDDELLPTALQNTYKAFQNKDVGFVYSDLIEAILDEYGEIVDTRCYSHDEYGNKIDGVWGSCKTGRHYWYEYKGKKLLACKNPNQNSQSIRHLTTMPNHLRCWRSDIYKKIGGHSPLVHVADDYELLIRTFLETKFAHINSVEYIQYFETGSNNTNTQYSRNAEIQRMVYWITKHYNEKIHKRFEELGVPDYCYKDGVTVNQFEDYGDSGKKFYTNLEL